MIQHRLLTRGKDGGEIVAAHALVRAALYDRAGRAYVPVARLMAEIGVVQESPPLPPEIEAFLASEDAMRGTGTRGSSR